MPNVSHLECSVCGSKFEAGRIHNLCQCGGALLVRYDLDAVRRSWNRDSVAAVEPDAVALLAGAAGARPRVDGVAGRRHDAADSSSAARAAVGAERLWVKDEGLNPTGSFKARGMSCAISMARELGITRSRFLRPGMPPALRRRTRLRRESKRTSSCPRDVPQANYIECKALGAHVTLVDGLISDCGRMVAERKDREGWFDMSTLKEPYRMEGKKTMGYEVAEQFGWELPDAIFYPTGGGVGLIGMWKAFEEMEALGWIGSKRPEDDCGAGRGLPADGARVRAGRFARRVLAKRFDGGGRVAGAEAIRRHADSAMPCAPAAERRSRWRTTEILDAGIELASIEGIFAAPEGAACIAALQKAARHRLSQGR